uniref:(northern house mosquito) hypothetical protein n=1 Tax=Culex pipiens TaxID=7175 RepID=A0A8D8A428_CULPI
MWEYQSLPFSRQISSAVLFRQTSHGVKRTCRCGMKGLGERDRQPLEAKWLPSPSLSRYYCWGPGTQSSYSVQDDDEETEDIMGTGTAEAPRNKEVTKVKCAILGDRYVGSRTLLSVIIYHPPSHGGVSKN